MAMDDAQRCLWERIRAFPLDRPSAFAFSERLARENGWALPYALRVGHEYKRFICLLALGFGPLTPSDQVDQAWHLHLIYTESYWKEFCGGVLGMEIHHGPTKGGAQERQRYNDLYGRTKACYREVFGEDAPEDIWPPHHIRFGEIVFTRVNRHRYWVLRKPEWLRKLWRKLSKSSHP
jgi:hypothetical protein